MKTAQQALDTLIELGIRHLPVLKEGQVVGVVSERDLLELTGARQAEVRAEEAEPSSLICR